MNVRPADRTFNVAGVLPRFEIDDVWRLPSAHAEILGYSEPVFSSRGPSLPELAAQALSSVEGGYDRLAPKFDRTPFRTHDAVLGATIAALARLGPFGPGRVLWHRGGPDRPGRGGPGTDHRGRLQRGHVGPGPPGGPGRRLGPGRRPGPAVRGRVRPGGQLRGARALTARGTAPAGRPG